MKRANILFKLSLLLIVITLFLGGCTNDEIESEKLLDDSTGKKVLQIGTANAKPWTWEEDGEMIGVGIDVLNEICKRLGYDYELHVTNVPGMFGNLDSGRIDFIALKLGVTDERKDKYTFSDVYLWEPNKLIVRVDEEDIESIEDLKGKTIAVGSGQVNHQFIMDYKKENDPNNEINVLVLEESATEAVKAGQADALISSEPNFNVREKEQPSGLKAVGESLSIDENAYLFRKDVNPEFLKEFNEVIKAMQDEQFFSEAFTEVFGIDTSIPDFLGN